MARQFSSVKEIVAPWSQVRQYLRSGDGGDLIPVVIPKDRRGYGPLLFTGLAIFALITAVRAGGTDGLGWVAAPAVIGFFASIFFLLVGLRRQLLVEIEEGTTGILSSWGEIIGPLSAGRQIIIQRAVVVTVQRIITGKIHISILNDVVIGIMAVGCIGAHICISARRTTGIAAIR